MSAADILFQYHSTSANTDLGTGDLIYVASGSGQAMVRSLFLSPTNGATNNVVRVHHCGPREAPAASNCLFRATASKDNSLDKQFFDVRIVLNSGDRLFAALHGGSGITITGYCIVPGRAYPGGAPMLEDDLPVGGGGPRHEGQYGFSG